jgi:hypothetical protein
LTLRSEEEDPSISSASTATELFEDVLVLTRDNDGVLLLLLDRGIRDEEREATEDCMGGLQAICIVKAREVSVTTTMTASSSSREHLRMQVMVEMCKLVFPRGGGKGAGKNIVFCANREGMNE